MGCDIHAFFEIKLNGKWYLYDQPNLERNYSLFGKMAGVRNGGIQPISPPKDLPKNLSKVVELEYKNWKRDAHSMSWLNAEEIKEVIEWHKKFTDDYLVEHKQWGYLFGNGWPEFNEYRESYPSEIEDIRLVFWFDN